MSQGEWRRPRTRPPHPGLLDVPLPVAGSAAAITHGATDELGYRAVEDVVHVRDLHATILHLLGIDHERFSVRYQGLDTRLTGVEEAHVVRPILA